MHLRPAEKKDNPELARLIRNVLKEFKVDRPGTVYTDPTTDDLFSLFGTPHSILWVAEDEGKLVGLCGVYPTSGLPEGCAELVKFYLSAEARGKGTGTLLMEKSIESARQMGYRQLYLESFPELEKAVSLYLRNDFRHIPHPLGNSGHFACTIWMIKDL